MSRALAPLHGGLLRRAFQNALVFDRKRADLGFALRCSMGVAIPLIGALAAGHPSLGVPGAMGAMSVGFTSKQGLYRTRAAVMLVTATAMALATCVGAGAGKSTVALVLLMALFSYGYGVISALGPSASSAGLNAIVALIIFSGQAAQPMTAAALPAGFPPMAVLQPLLVFAGGLVQTVLLVFVWPLSGYSAERRALAAVYRGLGAYGRTVAQGIVEMPDAQKIAAARKALADPQPFARRGDIAAFQSLLDCAERIRASLAIIASERAVAVGEKDESTLAALSEVAGATAKLADEIADALSAARAPEAQVDDWRRADIASERAEGLTGRFAAHVGDEARGLFGQLRSAWRIAGYPAGGGTAVPGERSDFGAPGAAAEPPPAFAQFHDAMHTLRASLPLSSPFGRHALRLAVTLALATAIYRGFAIDRGYWMTLTALIVLKPDFTTSFVRGLLRIIGTLIGALLASGLSVGIAHGPRADVAFAILFALLGYWLIDVNWGLLGITVTAYIVFLFSLLGLPDHAAIADRVLATLYGGGLAVLAMFVWPTWEGKRAGEQIAELIDALRRYAMLVLGAYAEPATFEPAQIRQAQAAAWTARLEAETSVDRAVGEPPQTHVLPRKSLLGILAATRRIGFTVGLLALNARLQHAAPHPRPALGTFLDSLSAAFERVAASIREGRVPQKLPPLRREFEAMRREIELRDDREAPLVLAECDFLVDALNTAAQLAAEGAAAIENGSPPPQGSPAKDRV
ncbi:MAG: FUSC family protein [Candidatus Velthaea sp.]|jgi:uncharacterized membrane protein YccC